jgi:drug/metabolite transporter (DMT)-like permease
MGFAFVFWQKAMQKATSTDKISNLVFLSPFLALIFIAQILNETILPSTFLGLVFIVGGIVIQKVRKVQI